MASELDSKHVNHKTGQTGSRVERSWLAAPGILDCQDGALSGNAKTSRHEQQCPRMQRSEDWRYGRGERSP